MLRSIVCSLVALFLVVGVTVAEKKEAKKGTAVSGTFESYKDGVLTLSVKTKKDAEAKKVEFKVSEDTKVQLLSGEEKKELSGKAAFADVKVGTPVVVKTEEGKVTGVSVGAAKKKTK